MKNDSTRLLLDDVLQEERGFHEHVLEQMLRQARRRRLTRRAVRGGAALLTTALLAALLLSHKPSARSPSVANNVAVPASVLAIVETRLGSLDVFSSSPGAVAIVETASGSVEPVSDERLLALIAPRPAALVWRSPREAELVFADNQPDSGAE